MTHFKKIGPDDYYFSAFASLARHNIYIVLHSIDAYIGKPSKHDDDAKINNFNCLNYIINNGKKKSDIIEKITSKLEYHFPFLELLLHNKKTISVDKKKKVIYQTIETSKYYEKLIALFDQITDWRDIGAHAEDIHKKKLTAKFVEDLRKIYDASWHKTKEGLSLSVSQMDQLVRLKGRQTKNHDKLQVQKDRPNFKYGLINDSNHFSEQGLAFLICLFLQESEANLFLKHVEHVWSNQDFNSNSTNLNSSQAIKLFTAYRLRLPFPKLQSSHDSQSLFLDMINSLKKCPSILFNHISNLDKKKFKKDIKNSEVNFGSEELITNENIETVHEVRKRDRFVIQALEYFDLTNTFNYMRFHIDLGKFIYKTYTSPIDGTDRIRRLEKNLHAFDKIQEVIGEKRPEIWKNLIKEPNTIPEDSLDCYIVDTEPHYHISDHKIGFKVFQNVLPSFHDIVKIGENNFKFSENPKPDGFISIYELPAMVFYEHITGNHGKSEEIIREHIKQRRKIITEVLNDSNLPLYKTSINLKLFTHPIQPEFINIHNEIIKRKRAAESYLSTKNIDYRNIPESIIYYIANIDEIPEDIRIYNILESMKLDAKEKLNNLKNRIENPQKKGKRGAKALLDGQLATELSKDILYLQPSDKDAKNKANPLEYQILQAKLSKFNIEKSKLYEWFKEIKLISIEETLDHPFLFKLNPNNFSSIVSFYTEYFKWKVKYLEYLIKNNITPGFVKLNNLNFKARISTYIAKKNYASSKTDEYYLVPTQIPHGFFTPYIIQEIEKLPNGQAILSSRGSTKSGDQYINFEYIVKNYFSLYKEDSNQSYYQFKRNYEIFDIVNDTRTIAQKNNPLPSKDYSVEEMIIERTKVQNILEQLKVKNEPNVTASFGISTKTYEKLKSLYKHYNENEKNIRIQKTKDMVTFLMCERLFPHELFENTKSIGKLKEINPDNSTSILNSNINIEKSITLKRNFGETNYSKTITHTCKLKDSGVINKLLNDRRLPELLLYFNTSKIPFEIIIKELLDYNTERIDFFKAIIDFEKRYFISESKKKLKTLEANEYRKHSELINTLIGTERIRDEAEAEGLWSARNAFYHNQYPKKELFHEYVTNIINKSTKIAKPIIKKSKNKYDNLP